MPVDHLQAALREYPCGPGGHRASYGMGLSQLGSATCAVCFKRLSAADCLFCARPASGAEWAVASATRGAEGRLCDLCREALTLHPEWSGAPLDTETARR